MKFSLKGVAAATALTASATIATAEDISLRIASGHPQGVVYIGLMVEFF